MLETRSDSIVIRLCGLCNKECEIMNWIKKHKGRTQLLGFLLTAIIFGFVGWQAGMITLVVSVLVFETLTRIGKKDEHNV